MKAKVTQVQLASGELIELGGRKLKGLYLPNGSFSLGNKPEVQLKEINYQLALNALVDGTLESCCDVGKIDIETDEVVIEVKEGKSFKAAIGQVLAYSYATEKSPIIAYYGDVNDKSVAIALELGIKVLNVSKLYKKVNPAKSYQDTPKVASIKPIAYDYSDGDVLTKRCFERDPWAYAYIRKNIESVLKYYLDTEDSYMMYKAWEISTGLSILPMFDLATYPHFLIDEILYDMIANGLSLKNAIYEMSKQYQNIIHNLQTQE